MRWIVRLLVLYAAAIALVIAIAVTASSTDGAGWASHSQMDPVSHGAYELHRSIGLVP